MRYRVLMGSLARRLIIPSRRRSSVTPLKRYAPQELKRSIVRWSLLDERAQESLSAVTLTDHAERGCLAETVIFVVRSEVSVTLVGREGSDAITHASGRLKSHESAGGSVRISGSVKTL